MPRWWYFRKHQHLSCALTPRLNVAWCNRTRVELRSRKRNGQGAAAPKGHHWLGKAGPASNYSSRLVAASQPAPAIDELRLGGSRFRVLREGLESFGFQSEAHYTSNGNAFNLASKSSSPCSSVFFGGIVPPLIFACSMPVSTGPNWRGAPPWLHPAVPPIQW